MPDDALLKRRHQLLGTEAPLFYDRPLHLVRGEGVWLWDSDGRRYLDAYNNVPHVGHCHTHVVEALVTQAKTLNTSTRYLDDQIVSYGEKLTATFDKSLERLALCCSGTEATELALRIARACTGNEGVIVTDFCYHGNSSTVAALSTAFLGPEGIDPRVRTITVPEPYRLRDGVEAENAAEAYAADVADAIASLANAGMKPAAILFDTVFATEGLPNIPAGYVEKAVALVREAGGLYIADEVQPGFGRTGSGMWGYQLYDAVPDLVTLGKPMGNGHPLAGVVSRAALIDAFTQRAMYFNTFGGNPVACAVGRAVLEVIEKEGLVENARVVGAHLQEGLRALGQKHPMVGEGRGHGLFVAVELVSDRASRTPAPDVAKGVVNGMRERGVLISRTGRHDNVLKVRPPMPFGTEHADQLLAALDDTLRAV
jgi:4-aminobutyrate aminotransferase-like enzyme